MTIVPTMTDDDLVAQAADVARAIEAGQTVSPAVPALLRAVASTREETARQELARQAHERAGQLGEVALQVLRVALFALA